LNGDAAPPPSNRGFLWYFIALFPLLSVAPLGRILSSSCFSSPRLVASPSFRESPLTPDCEYGMPPSTTLPFPLPRAAYRAPTRVPVPQALSVPPTPTLIRVFLALADHPLGLFRESWSSPQASFACNSFLSGAAPFLMETHGKLGYHAGCPPGANPPPGMRPPYEEEVLGRVVFLSPRLLSIFPG